jgi:protocatechuate 3,4-dioxygenase beta subunit
MQAQPDGSHVPVSEAGADAGVMAVGDAGAGGGDFFPPMFTDAPTCTLTGTDSAGEGPFFIHEDEVMTDPSLKRVDMRDGREGVEMQLNYRLLDQDGMCMKPIADVEVYTWHTDALGFYSGFNNQNPNQTYMGGIERTVENMDRFCRGMQVTNAEGVVSFRTIYPGWYYGRPIHIHFVALRKGSMAATSSYRSAQYHIFTTQLYFEEAFSRMIHEKNAPYTMRTSGSGYSTYVKPNAQSMVRPTVRMEGNVVVASLNIITKASGSRR